MRCHAHHAAGFSGWLCDGVVDGDLGQRGPQALAHLGGAVGAPGGRDLAQRGHHLGLRNRHLLEQHTRLCNEHPGVPEIPAVLQVLGRRRLVWLLNELGHVVHIERREVSAGLPARDVSETCGGKRGMNADRRDVALVCRLHRSAHRALKEHAAANHVVGGERTENGLRISQLEQGRRETDCRRRVLWLGLDNEVIGTDLRELPLD